jgi:hypothetical protein
VEAQHSAHRERNPLKGTIETELACCSKERPRW